MTSTNGFLINTGVKLVLIDTGAGPFMGPAAGRLSENLKAAGYTPDQIYLTHMHLDHLGALTSGGKKNFPNAVVRVRFEQAKPSLAPYKASDKFKPFDGETELVAGVHAYPANGETPGHTVYSIESGDRKLWLIGNMFHVAAVQFPKPAVTLLFDSNNKDFEIAAKSNELIGAAHLSFPGIGHIRTGSPAR